MEQEEQIIKFEYTVKLKFEKLVWTWINIGFKYLKTNKMINLFGSQEKEEGDKKEETNVGRVGGWDERSLERERKGD